MKHIIVEMLAPVSAAPAGELSDEQIKAILLGVGYTIKPGLDDLKPYVYAGARALLTAAPQPPAQPAGDEFEAWYWVCVGDENKPVKDAACSAWEECSGRAQAALAAKDAELAVRDQIIRNLQSRNAGLATDLASARQHLPAHAPAFSTVAAGKLAELQAKGFAVNGVSIEKTEGGRVTRGFVTHGGLVGWWSPAKGSVGGEQAGAGASAEPAPGVQYEAIDLADSLDREFKDNEPNYDTMVMAAAELRRQHARIAELEAQLEAVAAAPKPIR